MCKAPCNCSQSVNKCHLLLAHCKVYPSVPDSNQATLPPGSFLTCSSDDTIRVWNIEDGKLNVV